MMVSIWLGVSVSSLASSFRFSDYPKFPDAGTPELSNPSLKSDKVSFELQFQLQHFQAYLNKLNAAEASLIEECTGRGGEQLARLVRGQKVLIWPEQFNACDGYWRLLSLGDSGYEVVLSKLNLAFSTKYSPPRGSPALLEKWQTVKRGILHFDDVCDSASRKILLSGQPGFNESENDVFQAMKSRCPASWVKLFQPDKQKSEKVKDAKDVCPPGISVDYSDESSPTGLRQSCYTPEDEPARPGSKRKRSKLSAEDSLETELAAIKSGGYKNSPSMSGDDGVSEAVLAARRTLQAERGGLSSALGEAVTEKGRRLSEGGIFGGETGKLLEQTARVAERSGGQQVSSGGCDDERERQATIKMQEPRLAQIQRLPQHQQGCPFAQLNVDIYQRALGYAERCNRRETIPAIRAEIDSNQALVRQECNSAQGVSSTSRSNSLYGSGGNRDAGSGRRCLQWRGGASDPVCVSWSQ